MTSTIETPATTATTPPRLKPLAESRAWLIALELHDRDQMETAELFPCPYERGTHDEMVWCQGLKAGVERVSHNHRSRKERALRRVAIAILARVDGY